MDVVVLGAGYAGVTLLQELEQSLPESVDITIVDEQSEHLVQHLLHRVVRDPDLAEQITIPVSELCDRATFRQGTVTEIEPDAGRVVLGDETLEYDLGAVCLGARTAYYGLSGVKEHSTPLKRLEDAEQIREDFLSLDADSRVIVGGAGLSGIQIAGELAEMDLSGTPETTDEPPEADPNSGTDEPSETDGDSGTDKPPETDPDSGTDEPPEKPEADDRANDTPEIILLEQEKTVAPSFPEQFQQAVTEELTARGVIVRTDETVQRATGDELVFADESRLGYDQFIWTGGIAGPDSLGERPQVRGTLRLGERTFGVGDAVQVIDANSTRAPASAQTAIRQADVVAENIQRLVEYHRGDSGFEPRLDRYTYDSEGWVVTIGDGTVAQVGSRVLHGTPARALKTTIGAQYLGAIGDVRDAIEFARDSFHF